MADQANIVGKVTVDTSDAMRSMNALKRAVDTVGGGFSGFAEKAAGSLDSFSVGLAKFNLALGGIQKAIGIAKDAWGLAQFAGHVRQMDMQVRALGVSVDHLSNVAGGTITNLDLMKLALKNLQGEGRLTKEQFELVLRASDNLADQGFGEQIKIAEDLALALKGGPTEALMRYGFALDKTKTGQARVNDLMRQATKIASDGATVDARAKAMERAAKGAADAWNDLKVAVGGGAAATVEAVLDVNDAWDDMRRQISLAGEAYAYFFSDQINLRGHGLVSVGRGIQGNPQAMAEIEAARAREAARHSIGGGVREAAGAASKFVRDFAANLAYEFEKGSAVAERRRAAKSSGAGYYEHEYAQFVSWGELSDERRQGELDALIEAASPAPHNSVFSRVYQGTLANTAEMNKVTGSAVADLLRASDLIKQNEQMREANEHLEAMNNWMIVGTPAVVAFADALMSGGNAFSAMAKGLQQGLRALAIDSAVKALYALGEGLLFDKPEKFAAAGKYAAAAAAAGVGSAAIGSMIGSGGGGSAAPSVSSAGASIGGGSSSTGGNAPIIVNVSGVIGPPQEMGRIITNAINEAQRTGRARARDASRWS